MKRLIGFDFVQLVLVGASELSQHRDRLRMEYEAEKCIDEEKDVEEDPCETWGSADG